MLGLFGLSAVQMAFGLWVGRLLWRRRAAASHRFAARQSAENWCQMHQMAGSLSAQAGMFAHEIAHIQQQLALSPTVDDPQLQETLQSALTRFGQINERLQAQLDLAESRLEHQTRQIESHMTEARTDALTGLYNRRAFDDEIVRCVDECQRCEEPTTLILVDVDYFKTFNDTYGHQAGDDVLRGVAKVLYANVRQTNLVCRYGGEEFAIVCPGQVASETTRLTERVRRAVELAVFSVDDKQLSVTVSCGLSELTQRDSVEDLIRRADEALYASKSAGRNCAHLHDGQNIVPITHYEQRPSADSSLVANSLQSTLAKLGPRDTTADGELDSRIDALTGLPNRRAFAEDLRRRLAHWRKSHAPVTLVLVDVDDMNVINHTHSRAIGDITLRAVAQFIGQAIRELDVVARYHGDEFVVLLPDSTLDDGIRTAKRIRAAIGTGRLRLSSGDMAFTVSMGVAQATVADDAISLVARLSQALEVARTAGPGGTYVHDGRACGAIETAMIDDC